MESASLTYIAAALAFAPAAAVHAAPSIQYTDIRLISRHCRRAARS